MSRNTISTFFSSDVTKLSRRTIETRVAVFTLWVFTISSLAIATAMTHVLVKSLPDYVTAVMKSQKLAEFWVILGELLVRVSTDFRLLN